MQSLAISCCGTCKQSRFDKGVISCLFMNMTPVTFRHVCQSFQVLGPAYTSFRNAERSGVAPSCSASTTATNSHLRDFSPRFSDPTPAELLQRFDSYDELEWEFKA